LNDIKDICKGHHIREWYGIAKSLDEALTVPFPREMEHIREDAQAILNTIEVMKTKEEPDKEVTA
jgi:hypothetical protein